MMAISSLKVAAALAKQGADLVSKPSDGSSPLFDLTLGIQLVPNPSDPFSIHADISGPGTRATISISGNTV